MAACDDMGITLSEITVRYGSKVALNGAGLQVAKGTIHGLIGNNGAGKTTLLKTVIGFLQPSSGTISFCAHRLSDIAFSPEEPVLYEYLSARENLRFAGAIAAKEPGPVAANEDMRNWIDDISAQARRLSSGNRKKLSIAMALETRRSFLLLDEPLRGLDPSSRHMLKNLIREAVGNGKTVLWSSHELDLVEDTCQDLTVLHKGRVLYTGSLSGFMGKNSAKSLEEAFIKTIKEA